MIHAAPSLRVLTQCDVHLFPKTRIDTVHGANLSLYFTVHIYLLTSIARATPESQSHSGQQSIQDLLSIPIPSHSHLDPSPQHPPAKEDARDSDVFPPRQCLDPLYRISPVVLPLIAQLVINQRIIWRESLLRPWASCFLHNFQQTFIRISA